MAFMEHQVSVEKINEYNSQIRDIVAHLENGYLSIKNDLQNVEDSIDNLNSWNGSDASETWHTDIEEIARKEILTGNTYVKKRTCYYKYIWNISTQNDLGNEEISYLDNVKEQIDILDSISQKIDSSAEQLAQFIYQLECQLGIHIISKCDKITDFFQELKNNEAWEEMKKVSEEAKIKKQNDEIYQKYRSKSGQADLVDCALDELGNKFLLSTYSTKYALWYKENYPGQGASGSDNWCAEFVTYSFDKSGNIDKITPYLSVETGKNQAIASANKGVGSWHNASDKDYQPKRGDIFYKSGHTGIVIASDENYIYTIEGNTIQDDGVYYVKDGASNSGGGFVNTRIRRRDYVNYGYYSPDITLNASGIEQSLDTSFSSDYLDLKNATQDKYNILRAQGGHATKHSMG